MKHIFQIGLVIVAVTMLFSCGQSEVKTKKTPPPQAYNTVALEPRQISSSIQLPGVMQPFQFVQIFPKVNGFVKSVSVDRGSVVRKGSLLLQLEAPEIQEHVAAAKLKYTEAYSKYMVSKDHYQRMLETSKTPGTISSYDLNAALSKMEGDSATAKGEWANYKAQQEMQNYLTVTAPFDGVITERNVHPGALVGPGSGENKAMLVLQQQNKLRLVMNVPEQYSAQINDKDEVRFKVNAIPGKDFKGKVSRSSGNLNDNFRSETMEIDISNPENVFKPGMYAEVFLKPTGNVSAYVVPRSAIVTTTEKKYVVVVDNGIAKWIDVSEGNQTNDSTEIFGNLHTGDKIITNASYQIKQGEQIK